ncbi:site-specific integrase [Actinomadura sp. 6K520]|uniref:site-specific integrase n=1 Tax=Actinomadura sp. 6K520 TaxID=2530364 RepID=UPI0010454339|nr:site-specific integrase [Actinomadura sp. 6K520]TDE35461.1 site-specific integrase [Actinomadura sp. 6K520]
MRASTIGAWITRHSCPPGARLRCSRLGLGGRSTSHTCSGRSAGSPRLPTSPRPTDCHPHSLRHSVVTLLLDRGHPLHVVQDFLGHADPRTTRSYDTARESLDRSPAYDLGTALAAGVARHVRTYAAH